MFEFVFNNYSSIYLLLEKVGLKVTLKAFGSRAVDGKRFLESNAS